MQHVHSVIGESIHFWQQSRNVYDCKAASFSVVDRELVANSGLLLKNSSNDEKKMPFFDARVRRASDPDYPFFKQFFWSFNFWPFTAKFLGNLIEF